jgi:dipeptidyl aminopeptidase/acylaminoacyl peptidase
MRCGVVVGVIGAALVALGLVTTGTAVPADTPRWLVFSAYPNGAGAPQLFRVQTTGEGLQQITTGRLPATAPAFARGGNRIAFVRLGSGLFVMNVDGTGLRRVTSGRRDSHPAWSANGKRIAFLRPYQRQWRVYVMSATGAGKRRLPQGPPAGRPTWTSDGKALFTPSAGDLFRIDARTGKVLRVYGLQLDIETAHTATVSPGGGKVAYVGPRVSTGPPDCGEGRCPQFGLYLANVRAPHRPRRLINDTGPAGWSADGKSLVFVARGALTLFTVANGKRTAIPTATHVATGDSPPAWQP